jgi:hypothetical protein
MMRLRTWLPGAMLLTLAGGAPAFAGAILSPTSVPIDNLGLMSAAHIIDESGLSASFTSGSTDYDSYIAGNPTHAAFQFLPPSPNAWASGTGFSGKFMEFDLGSNYAILGFALWTNNNPTAVNSFTLSSAADQDFTTGVTSLGTFTAVSTLAVQSYDVSGLGEFVRLTINSDHGATNVNIGEVAFDVQVVPEPASLAILGLGIAALARIRRKRAAVL